MEQAKNGSDLVNASEATTWIDIAYLEVTGPRYAGQTGKELSLRWWCDNIVESMRAGK
jgi:hypothetical protein